MRRLLARLTRPVVHPWMTRPPSAAGDVARQLDGHLATFDAALARAGTPACGPPADLRRALVAAREAFAGLEQALARCGPALTAEVAALGDPRPGRVRAARRRIRALTDELSRADAACRTALEGAVRVVPESEAVAAGPGWRAALTGVSSPRSPLSPGPGLRAHLAGCGAGEVAAVLAERPDLAGSLAQSAAPAAGAPGWPDGVVRALRSAPGPERVAAVRAAFAGLPAEEATRAALLWPAAVGPLDGAPAELRFLANRLLVRHALGRARRTDAGLEARAIARRAADATPWRRLRAWVADLVAREPFSAFLAFDSDRPLIVRGDLRVRIRLYQSLLYDGPPGAGRRVLLFDPAGRGRIAEWFGAPPEQAAHVAVVVPGTGTAVRGFHLPAETARALAAADPTGRTGVLAWMGADFPLALGNQAVLSRFALAAAAPLRDVVEALPLAPGASVTVIGHSYGGCVVGAAERLGLRADRVVYLACPGAGPGVRGVADLDAPDAAGRPRRVVRYAMTAPGDPIRWVQAVGRRRRSGVWARLLPTVVRRFDLGVDPGGLAGVVHLDAGVWEEPVGGHRVGEPVAGPAGHAALTAPGTTAFRRLVATITAPVAPPRSASRPGGGEDGA